MERAYLPSDCEVITMTALQEAHMKARIVRIGKAQGIHLPKALFKKAKLDDNVELRAEPGRIVISNTGKPRVGWAEAAHRMRVRDEDPFLDATSPTWLDKEAW
jgi:antitoxin component of MazEF toxin-antitoxin module